MKKIHTEGLLSHFWGSIVATKASAVEDDLLIIDSQQRITTISLLRLAAINAVANGDIVAGDEDTKEVEIIIFTPKYKIAPY